MPKKGESHTPEALEKLSEAARRRASDPAERERLSEAQRARRRREREAIVAQPEFKVCAKCGGAPKPVDAFYYKRRKLKSGGELLYPDSRCKECRKAERKEHYQKLVQELGTAEINRRKRSNVQWLRTYRRERSTIERRERGVAPRNFSAPRKREGSRNGLPSGPLAEFLKTEAASRSVPTIAAAVGVDASRIESLMDEEFSTVTLAVVDKVLHGLGCPEEIHFLYPEEGEQPTVGYHYIEDAA